LSLRAWGYEGDGVASKESSIERGVTGKIRSVLSQARPWAYFALLGVVLATWTAYMTASGSWSLFSRHWPVSVTMVFGSFIAGATPQGGAAVAFPVFTKILGIDPGTARTFGLLVQSVGMMMAAVVIVVRRVPILPRVILWASVGGFFGQIIGTFWFALEAPYSKILFSLVASVFAAALIVSRWVLKLPVVDSLPTWRSNDPVFYAAIGLIGGVFAANTGSGVDMLTFIVLTLAIGANEKVSTPTSVVIMGINSVVGAALHAFVLNDLGIAFDYWLVAIPVVVIGAPLGAYAASRVSRDAIIVFLVSLIGVELVSTILLVPFSSTGLWVSLFTVVASMLWFAAMLTYRVMHIVPTVHARRAIDGVRDDGIARGEQWGAASNELRPTESDATP